MATINASGIAITRTPGGKGLRTKSAQTRAARRARKASALAQPRSGGDDDR